MPKAIIGALEVVAGAFIDWVSDGALSYLGNTLIAMDAAALYEATHSIA